MQRLFDLYTALRLRGTPPDGWSEAELTTCWGGDEALWMAKLAERTATRHAQVAAACALARRVESLLPPEDRRPREAIAHAESWPEGERGALGRTADEAFLAEVDAAPGIERISAVKTAFAAARIALGDGALSEAVQHAENALRNGERVERDAALAELATILRAHLPCPTLAELRAAFAKRT
jgi:hypothetical protein